MQKQAQSILDFLDILSPEVNVLIVPGPEITNKEAQTLYHIWDKGNTDEYGRYNLSVQIDSDQITSLQTKGILRCPTGFASLHKEPTVEITKKGRDIIRDIVLFSDQSIFNQDDIDYQKVYTKMKLGPAKIAKTASNWLDKCK